MSECPATITDACCIPSCKHTLILGKITKFNTSIWIFVEKQNGFTYIEATTSAADGEVRLDLTQPSKEFYNEFDGQYQIWVSDITQGAYTCEDDREALKVGVTGGITTWGVNFERTSLSQGGSIQLKPSE